MRMRKKLLLLGVATFATFSARADGPEIKLSGGIDFQAGYFKNSSSVAEKNFITGNNKHTGLNTSAHLLADAHNTTAGGLEYGAKIALATTTNNARKASSSLYFISQAGKMEFGSDKSATAKMKITPYTNACATAGGWDSWVKSDPKNTKTVYMMNFGNFLDAKTRNGDKAEFSRKVTYYTPNFSGFQIGVSYIPDTTNAGYASALSPERHDPTKTLVYDIDIKNAWAGGITYENKVSEDMKFKIALVGETGKAIGHKKKDPKDAPPVPATVPDNLKFRKLKAYTIGAQVDYKDVSLTGAYSDYMKSLTSPELDNWHNKNTNMYGFGARYNHPSDVSGSVTYFASKNRGNNLKATTLAVEYKAAPGILPYAEVTFFNTKGRYQATATEIKTDKNHGTAVVLGLKMEF